jgi:transposase
MLRGVPMADYAVLTELLDLHNLRVVHYQLIGSERINLYVEPTLEMAVCPECGQVSVEIHETSEPQMVRDLSILNRRCWLRYAPRRFKCRPCGNTFVERVDWKEPGLSYTVRYERHVYQRTRREAIKQVAEDEGLSEEVTQGIFERWAKKRSKRGATHS